MINLSCMGAAASLARLYHPGRDWDGCCRAGAILTIGVGSVWPGFSICSSSIFLHARHARRHAQSDPDTLYLGYLRRFPVELWPALDPAFRQLCCW